MKLLISRDELLLRTPLNGNIDNDKLLPHMLTAQEIHLQDILGTKLYIKIVEDFNDGSIAGDYSTLLNDFIKPLLCHYSASDFYLFHSYMISNGGITKHQSENGIAVDYSEIKSLHTEQLNKAKHYRTRLVYHLAHFSHKFPEYVANQDGGMYPNTSTASNQWCLR